MKKTYIKPGMTVVMIQQAQMLCGSNDTVNTVSSNADLNYDPNGGSGPARVRSHGGVDWDDWK